MAQVELLLDCGSFSAWNRGEPHLDLKKYIAFVKANEKSLFGYVSLDVIPGVFGQKRTLREVENSAKQGYCNQQVMRDAGLNPIPVFHQGESFAWLDQFLKDGEPYIGISTAKDLSFDEHVRWLDQVYSILCDKQGRSLVKTHGFGITNPPLLFKYPFWTVDSTTWSLTPGFGIVIVPIYVNGKPDYLRNPIRITTSGIHQKSAANQKMQLEALGPANYKAVKQFLEQEAKVTVAECRYSASARRKVTLTYYLGLMKALRDVRFRGGSGGLFDRTTRSTHLQKSKSIVSNLCVMFATSLSKEWSKELSAVGANTRLLSYYELKNKPPEVLAEYVATGIVGSYTKKPPKREWSESYKNWRALQLARRVELEDLPWDA